MGANSHPSDAHAASVLRLLALRRRRWLREMLRFDAGTRSRRGCGRGCRCDWPSVDGSLARARVFLGLLRRFLNAFDGAPGLLLAYRHRARGGRPYGRVAIHLGPRTRDRARCLRSGVFDRRLPPHGVRRAAIVNVQPLVSVNDRRRHDADLRDRPPAAIRLRSVPNVASVDPIVIVDLVHRIIRVLHDPDAGFDRDEHRRLREDDGRRGRFGRGRSLRRWRRRWGLRGTPDIGANDAGHERR
jgi:hypothetical protein